MKTIIKYDILYFIKTSKTVVLGVLAVFLSALSVLSARYYNTLIEWALRSEGIEDVSLPVATVRESYIQFFAQYQQIFALVIFFIAVAFFTHDKSRGHYPWLFAHPLTRIQFLASKSFVMILAMLLSLLIGALVFGYYTWVIFDSFAAGRFFLALCVFSIHMILMIQVIQLFVTLWENFLVPLVLSLTVYFVLGALSVIEWSFFKVLPTQLMNMPTEIMLNDFDGAHVFWTILVSMGIIALMSVLSVKIFMRKALT